MKSLLDDKLNLKLLRYLVSGKEVRVNIRGLAKELNMHRSTVKKKIQWMFDNQLINPPFYPFPQLYKEYPLLVLVKADIPRTNETKEFFMDDAHIFAAFSCMEGPYNTLLMEFFKDLETYHSWREQIVIDQKIPTREHRAPAHAYIFSNKLTFKYDPNCFIQELHKTFHQTGKVTLNDITLDETTFPIFIHLMKGNFIQRNDTQIANDLEINRKTIKHRLDQLLKEQIISQPKCFFPNLFIPPAYNLIVSMIEVKSNNNAIKKYLLKHNNIARAQETSTGCYNLLIFSAFNTIEDFFDLGEDMIRKFPQDIGAIENIILSSRMIHTIKPQKLSLGWIDRRLWEIQKSTSSK
jgi:hypothetical protein